MQNAKHGLCNDSFSVQTLQNLSCNSILSPEAPEEIQMGEYLPWLARQEERAILKSSFPALVLREGTNLHASHSTQIFLRAKAVHHLYPPPLQETY